MVIAELRYDGHYSDQHDAIVDCLNAEFPDLQSGHQGDSWIWIGDDPNKISIDTFYSMRHQVKTRNPQSELLQKVLARLQRDFVVELLDEPEAEPDED